MHYRGTSSFHKCFDLNYTRKAIEILLLALKDYELAALFFDNARDITVLLSRTSRKFNQQNVSSCQESRKTFCVATESATQNPARIHINMKMVHVANTCVVVPGRQLCTPIDGTSWLP